MIVESGALYAVSVLSLLIAYLAKSNGQYAALDAVTPLVVRVKTVKRSSSSSCCQGIVFSLIVLQIHFHLGSETPYRTPVTHAADDCWGPKSAHPHTITPLRFPVQLATRSEIGYPDQSPDEENLVRNP